MPKNVLQGHFFLKDDIVEIVHSSQNYSVWFVLCTRTYALGCVAPQGQNAGCGGEEIAFSFYCVPSAEWLT